MITGKISTLKNSKGVAFPITTTNAVYMDDGSTKLNDKIEDIETSLDNNVRELDNKINYVDNNKASKEEVDIERQRINTLVKNDGTEINDVELQDIRVKADGTVAESAGDAVREQFAEIDSKIKKEYISSSFWELGGINGADGVPQSRTDRIRTVSYISKNIETISDTTQTGIAVFSWDKNDNYVGMWNGTDFGDTAKWVWNANIKAYRQMFPNYNFRVITKSVTDITLINIIQNTTDDIDDSFTRKGAVCDAFETGKRLKSIEGQIDNELYIETDITSVISWRSGSSYTNTGNLEFNDDNTKISMMGCFDLGICTITPKNGYQIYKLISDHEIKNGDKLTNWNAYGYSSDSYTTKYGEYILIKITAIDNSPLYTNNINDYITITKKVNPYEYIKTLPIDKEYTFENIIYPSYDRIVVKGFPNHDITFVDENLWAFDKPTEGGLKVYNKEFTQIGSANTQFYFNKKDGGTAELEMKSVDFNNRNRTLLVGNGSSKYVKGDSFLYLFYECEKWLSQGGTIDFSNCGAYTEIDVSVLGDKCYGFWGASVAENDQIFVSLNMFKDIYLIRLGKGTYKLSNGNYNYIDDDKYNGTFEVLNYWTQKEFITGEFGQHGGQFYKGSLYLVNNDKTKNQIYKCVLKENGSLKFDILELCHYRKNGNINYRYIDGMAIKDGYIYGSPLIVEENYYDKVNKEVLKIEID